MACRANRSNLREEFFSFSALAFRINAFALIFFLSGCSLSPGIRNQVTADWKVTESFHGSRATALHRQIFGDHGLDGRDYRAFFEKRVREIAGEGWGFASCHGALACQTGSRAIRLSESYESLRIPSVIRISFLLHEARHAEGYRHVLCPDPLLDSNATEVVSPYQKIAMSGKDECDVEPLGAYGVQIIMLRNIALNCENCRVETRKVADEYSKYLLNLVVSPRAKRILLDDALSSR